MRISLDPKLRRRIEDMLMEGLSCKKISMKTGTALSLVSCVKREMGLDEKSDGTMMQLYKWLQTHWNWKVENPPKKPTGKYRYVKRGEKGHLRTPYRPDGIFR